MAPILYKNIGSPPARTVLIVLDLLGVKDVEFRDLNPVLRDQDAPELRKKNPMRTVPMWDEGNFSLADSHAIVLYLLDKYGKPEHSYLYPADQKIRATVNQILFFDCGILFARLRAVMAPTYAGKLAEMSKRMIANIDDAYEILEVYLEDRSYMASDGMTIADISVLTTISSLHGLRPINSQKCPKLIRWLDRMNEKDVCKRINTPGSKFHVDGLLALMENAKFNQKSKL